MKKTISNFRILAALLMAGAAFAACSNSDDIINEQPVNPVKQGYTLTVSASKDGSTTRALDLDGSAVVASWKTTDEIVVTKADGTEVGTLSPTDISGVEATFTGTVEGDFETSEVLTLSYHPIASIEGFASQDGTLNGSATSAENFDMAVATVTISEISGNEIIVSESSANFVNQTAVVVLTPHKSYQGPGGTAGISSLVVSVLMDIPEVGTVTEEIGPISISGDLPYYFSLPSQSLLADFLAAKYSLTASEISTRLASATITFTGHHDYVYYLTCDKTGYKFAAGKYYKLDENNFVMTEVIKRSAAGKDVYVENQDLSWSNTVTFAVNRGIGWRVDGDYVFWGDKQLYIVDTFDDPMNPFEGWVRASDNVKHREATYSLRDPEPPSVTYTAPTIVSSTLTYNGSAQTLVTAGSATGGTIYYRYDYTPYSGSESSSEWSTTVPAPTNAGTYTVYYKVEAAAGYSGGVESTSLGSATMARANGWVSLEPNSSTGWMSNVGDKTAIASISHHGGSLSTSKSGSHTDGITASIINSGSTLQVYRRIMYRGDGCIVTVTSAATNNYNQAQATYTCNP